MCVRYSISVINHTGCNRTHLHLPEGLCEQLCGLGRGEVAGGDQPLAVLHEVSAELARVDPVLPPAPDAVGHADHVGAHRDPVSVLPDQYLQFTGHNNTMN